MKTDELKLIQELLGTTLHLNCRVVEKTQRALEQLVNEIYQGIFECGAASEQVPIQRYVLSMQPQTVYGITDRYELYYLFLPLPDEAGIVHSLLVLGPCLLESPTESFVLRVLRRSQLHPAQALTPFLEFYLRFPVLDQAILHTVGRTLGNYFYKGQSVDHRQFRAAEHPMVQPPYVDNAAVLLEMKALEQRYQEEQALYDAVAHGQRAEAFDIFRNAPLVVRSRRYCGDELRNARYACAAFHSRLRAAARQGGVHPLYLEDTAREFYSKIDTAPSLHALRTLAQEMLRRHIQLVQQMALPGCGETVRRAVQLIQSDLSAPMTVRSLAEVLEVHPNYLSRLFREQMGVPPIEYINRQRITRAVYYLNETDLPVRDIALYVGFEDINYFSRLFKRYVRRTPSEYRRIARGQLRQENFNEK